MSQPDRGTGPAAIPLSYRLRDGVRIEPAGGVWRVVSELPLAVVRVNEAAARMLAAARIGAAVRDLAAASGVDQERVVELCERFRRRGFLDVVAGVAAFTDPGVAPAGATVGSPAAARTGAAGGVSAGVPRRAPTVSVIVPTKDRAEELDGCLASLSALDYPRESLEVIVVDDGSTDDTADVARRYPCVYRANERNRGQSYCRNLGARAATGEILAFIDSDCVASPGWLSDLVPLFSWPRVAAAGGYVAGYYDGSRLDRYEQAASSLNMGERVILMTDDRTMAYLPTCNLLVRRDAYLSIGGLREEMRVGEDVDLCWRLRKAGGYLIYSPTGTVSHRHRRRLRGMLAQRAAYGTSEALLHGLHPEKRKTMPVRLLPALTTGMLALALVSLEPMALPLCVAPAIADALRGASRLARSGVRVPARRVWSAALRGHLSFAYSVSFHLVRYYLLVVVAAGFAAPGLWLLGAAAVVYVAAVDHGAKRPRVSFPVFLAFSVAEHTAYQVGVAAGCVRARSFRSYRISFVGTGTGGRLSRLYRAALPRGLRRAQPDA